MKTLARALLPAAEAELRAAAQTLAIDGQLLSFACHWLNLRGPEGALPSREQMRPEDMIPWLPQLGIIDVVRGGGVDRTRYRYRLLGTAHSSHNRADYTGRFVDEVAERDNLAEMNAFYAEIITSRRAGFWRSSNLSTVDSPLTYQRVLCPVADRDGPVTALFGMWAWEPISAKDSEARDRSSF